MNFWPSSSRSSNGIASQAASYVLAIALVCVATLVTLKTQPILGEVSPLFFAAVVFAAWYGGLGPALLATALAGWASAYYFFNFPAGTGIFWWDDLLRLGIFLMVALLMSSLVHRRRRAETALRKANDELENRVRVRTRELESSINELKRLEKEVLHISEEEQRRIGHDLHDGLGQELSGVAFLSQNLGQRLAEHSLPEAADANRISALINRAIEQTRELARGLSPVELGSDALLAAMRSLVAQARQTYGIPCELHIDNAVRVDDHAAAIHLYRIAQEALTNAARHSHASRIWISLRGTDRNLVLTLEDDGIGIARRNGGKGFGMHLMLYRARMIGATFSVQARSGGGTLVRCAYKNIVEPDGNNNGASANHERASIG